MRSVATRGRRRLPPEHRLDVAGRHPDLGAGLSLTGLDLPSNYTGVVGPLSVFDANRSDRARPGRRRSASRRTPSAASTTSCRRLLPARRHALLRGPGPGNLRPVWCPTPPAPPPAATTIIRRYCATSRSRVRGGLWRDELQVHRGHHAHSRRAHDADSKDWTGRQQVFVQQLPSSTGAIDPSSPGSSSAT